MKHKHADTSDICVTVQHIHDAERAREGIAAFADALIMQASQPVLDTALTLAHTILHRRITTRAIQRNRELQAEALRDHLRSLEDV